MRHRAALLGVIAAVAALVEGCGGALFACENANECAGAGAGARCEPDGWCSVDDDACPSGHRYGEHSGEGKAGVCVETEGTSSESTTMSSTSTTFDPSTVTTLDPTTSSSTIDPSMATLETTSSTGGESSSSEDATTIDPTDEGPQPVCGNAIVEADEECDGDVATDCEDLGWASGSLSCVDCSYDTSECVGCGPDGCSFAPCAPDDPRTCPAGESCADLVDGGMCTGECTGDEDCSHPRYETVCYMSQALMGICLVTCENGPCPVGMDCVPVTPPVCVYT